MGHGHRSPRTPTYHTWNAMRQRCTNPNRFDYKYYGALGVTVCDRWNKFENFLEDMGERPLSTTLDRINAFGNYEPDNCRWASKELQSQNQRRFYDGRREDEW